MTRHVTHQRAELARPPDGGAARSVDDAAGLRTMARLDALVLAAFPILAGAAVMLGGQDVSGDQLMYHFYGPHAFLHARHALDVVAAGFGTFVNPLPHLPFYLAALHLPARAVGFALGAFQGLNGSIVYALGLRLLSLRPLPARAVAVAAAVAGMLAPTSQFELGTTFTDTALSLPVLVACWLVVQGGAHRALLAGGLLGVATGGKLTFGVPAVALLGTAAVTRVLPLRRASAAAVAAIAGFLLTSGPFMVLLQRRYGSPLFPFYNALFRSPNFPATTFRDARWSFHSVGEVLASPLFFARHPERVFEWPLFDVRWVAFFTALAFAAIAWRRVSRPTRFLLAFIAVSYVLWAVQFAYLRYLAPLELVAVLAACAAVVEVCGGGVPATLVAVALAVGVAASTRVGSSAKTPWEHRWYRVEAPAFERPRDVVVLLEGELAFTVPFFQPEVAFIGLTTNFFAGPGRDGRLFGAAVAALRGKQVFHLGQQGGPPFRTLDTAALHASVGLQIDAERCRPVPTNVIPLELCPMVEHRGGPLHAPRAAVALRAPPPRAAQDGVVDSVVAEPGGLVIEGWGPWNGVGPGQGLEVFTDAEAEVVSVEERPRPDVAAAHPRDHRGRSGFRIEVRSREPIRKLCIQSVDRLAGRFELAAGAPAVACEALRSP